MVKLGLGADGETRDQCCLQDLPRSRRWRRGLLRRRRDGHRQHQATDATTINTNFAAAMIASRLGLTGHIAVADRDIRTGGGSGARRGKGRDQARKGNRVGGCECDKASPEQTVADNRAHWLNLP